VAMNAKRFLLADIVNLSSPRKSRGLIRLRPLGRIVGSLSAVV